jgi:hypothetical protein
MSFATRAIASGPSIASVPDDHRVEWVHLDFSDPGLAAEELDKALAGRQLLRVYATAGKRLPPQ